MKERLFENNNKAFAKKFARRSFKGSRMRTGLTLLTIVLSTALISGFAMFGLGLRQADINQIDAMQQVLYMNLSADTAGDLRADARVTDSRLVKNGIASQMGDLTVQPVYVEQTESEIAGVDIKEGRYPEKADEAAVDKAYLAKIGKTPQLGMELTFRYYNGEEETFRVSGFTDTGTTGRRFPLYLSEAYAVSGSQLAEIPYFLGVKLEGARDMSESAFLSAMTELGADYGVDRADINENNKFVTSLVTRLQDVLAIAAVGAFIFLASVIVVYSIFYISVVSRTRQFGQLRTLGASKKQIRRIVKKEGRLNFVMGAPTGLVLGLAFGYFIAPEGWLWLNAAAVGAAVLAASYVTIMVSVWKPAKSAAAVSPIEATKASGYEPVKKRGRRGSEKPVTPWRLAEMSAGRNRKKFVITVVSLCVSGIIFMAGTTFVASFDKLDYSRQGYMRSSEYQLWISDNAVNDNKNGLTGVQMENPLMPELIDRVEAIDGVNKVTPVRKFAIDYFFHNNYRSDYFVPFDREGAALLSENMLSGKMDYDKAVKEKYVYIVDNSSAKAIFGEGFELGEQIEVTWFDGQKERRDVFTVGGEVDRDLVYDPKGYEIVGPAGFFVVPEETLSAMAPESFNMNRLLMISTDWPETEQEVTAALSSIAEGDDRLTLETLSQKLKDDEWQWKAYFSMILGLSCLLILFGVINLVNTIVTGILSRKQEFAMLESIGMERRQIISMVQGEGLILAFYNGLFSLTLGGLAGWAIVAYLRDHSASYMQYQYPVRYALAYVALSAALPALISALTARVFSRQSIVERLQKRE